MGWDIRIVLSTILVAHKLWPIELIASITIRCVALSKPTDDGRLKATSDSFSDIGQLY